MLTSLAPHSRRSVSLALVPEAGVGDCVIVHVGFAITKLDEEAARRTLETYADLAASGSPDATGGQGNRESPSP